MQRHWDGAFSTETTREWELLAVIWDSWISEDGGVRREVRVRLKSKTDKLESYTWHVPHLQDESPPFGFRASAGNDVLYFEVKKITNDDRTTTKVIIHFPLIDTDEETAFRLSYYENQFARLRRNRILFEEWDYNWVYNVQSETRYLEIRAYFPKGAKIIRKGLRDSLSGTQQISRFDNRVLYAASANMPSTGVKAGIIPYRRTSAAIPATVSLIGGLLLTGLTSSLAHMTTLEGSVIFVFIVAVIYTVHFVIDKIE